MAASQRFGSHSRFTDVYDEPIEHLLTPIKGYQNKPLVPLPDAIEPVSGFFNEIEDNVAVALHNSRNPADGLNQNESAAIHLYTMQFDIEPSLYVLLNQSLRAEVREELKPWFLYLKLFLTALYKLPSKSRRVWRGIRDVDLSSKYKTGTQFAWWGVSSCTTAMEVLESEQFLGKSGLRTLFSIECVNGKSVVAHSYFKKTEQEIILMPGSYFKVLGQLNPAPGLHIIELKEIKPPVTLVKPPFSQADEQKVDSSLKHQSSSLSGSGTGNSSYEQLATKLQQLSDENRLLKSRCDQQKAENQKLGTENQVLHENYAEYQDEIGRLNQDNKRLKREAKQSNQQIKNLNEENQRLQEQLESMKRTSASSILSTGTAVK